MADFTGYIIPGGPAEQSLQTMMFTGRERGKENILPEILIITSYPPRECGIATYSQDLIKALYNKFDRSFTIGICPVESGTEQYDYPEAITHVLNTDYPEAFVTLAKLVNDSSHIAMVMVQHEFGLFRNSENNFLSFLNALTKPVIIAFHTVLPQPGPLLKLQVQAITQAVQSVIVMTKSSEKILLQEYRIPQKKITVIPHGTHLVTQPEKELLKNKYHLSGKKVLSTFGLLSSGKSIETTLQALPAIIAAEPDTLFLIIGKTHPAVIKNEGERYRVMLQEKVHQLHLQEHVRFINHFLPLADLLEYLQLSDIYLFTSKDPNQAVSGTFSYAISCGCPVISTPIPHALEVLGTDAGIIVGFENSGQVAKAVIDLLGDEERRMQISSNGLHTMASTAWENAAVAHALLFKKMRNGNINLHYALPAINLDHVKRMTTTFGIIQFSIISRPDIGSGYTLDDNARALIAMCRHFELTGDTSDLKYIEIYFRFIKFCLQPQGYFLNYVDQQKKFTDQNSSTNLSDSNGRAIWALGYLLSTGSDLPAALVKDAERVMQDALMDINKIHSTRSLAFIIKGLYYRNLKMKTDNNISLIEHLANRLVQMYRHEAGPGWQWFESYLTYANSILPEAMLCSWLATGQAVYKDIALSSFDFLLSKIFTENSIKVISNKNWLQRGDEAGRNENGGEQPIDVAYTIITLRKFYNAFGNTAYLDKMKTAFDWFLGNNHLHQIMYNPCTGGCYDGLEERSVNLNQGAESTLSYLMARLTIEQPTEKFTAPVAAAMPAMWE